MQELDGNSAENEAPEVSLVSMEAGDVSEVVSNQEPTNPGLSSGCIVSVVIDSSDVVMDPHPDLGHVETAQALSMPEVLQQSEMVTEAFASSMEMAGMVESISETKS